MTDRGFSAISRRHFMIGAGGIGLAAMTPGWLWAKAARNGTLNYSTLGLDTSDPHRHTGSIGVQQAYVEALTSIGPDGKVQPWLAESFDVAPDGLQYTFKLRPNIKFHNGDTLTAADVVANANRVKSKIKGGWLSSTMEHVATVEAPNEETVVIKMKEPFAPLVSIFSQLWILSPKSEGWDATITKPIGTGPFTFGKWRPQVDLIAPAFESYWVSGLPHVEAVKFDLRGETDMSLAVLSGDMDVGRVSIERVKAVKDSSSATVMPYKGSTWYFVSFNNRTPKPPFDDIRVRQAIAYALDKPSFMQFIGGEFGQTNNQMATRGTFYFDQKMYEADPYKSKNMEKAKALLEEAGVDPGSRTIKLISWQEDYAQVAVQMIHELGFEINHIALDDIGAQKRLAGDDWDVNVMSSGPRSDLYLRYVRLLSNGPNPVLWGNIRDPELDAMIEQSAKEPDDDKRRALYREAMEYINKKLYFIVLGDAPELLAVQNDVKGFEPGFTWSCNWEGGGIAHADLRS